MDLFGCETMIPHETFFNISALIIYVALFLLGLFIGLLIFKCVLLFMDNKKDNEVKNNGR
jgi:fructose-specific phosphotransferase system IIC component